MQIEKICQSYSAEIACVVLCCRVYIKTATADELEQFIGSHEMDWQEVYKVSALHRVRPLVYHVLAHNKQIPVPAAALSQLYNFCQLLTVFAFERRIESARIQQVLAQHEIPSRLYKGLDFIMTAYGGDIGMREFTDMDLIVDERHLPALIEVMIAEGYTSSQVDFYRRFPMHFIKGKKDICFAKRNSNGRLFNFEFHYRPTDYLLDLPLGFSDLLGKDYLTSTLPITRQRYYQLMLINHGLADFYPNLRALVDLVLLTGAQSMYVPQALQRYERLGKTLTGRLLGVKESAEVKGCRHADVLTARLLTCDPLTFKEKMSMRIRFSGSPRTLLKALQLVIVPNEVDINRTRYRYFLSYYFVKPFRLLRNLISGKEVLEGN